MLMLIKYLVFISLQVILALALSFVSNFHSTDYYTNSSGIGKKTPKKSHIGTIMLVEETDPFTPNCDGIKDVVRLTLDGNEGTPVLDIYGVGGDRVYHTESSEPIWYGKDESGRQVREDAFFYHLIVDGYIYSSAINL